MREALPAARNGQAQKRPHAHTPRRSPRRRSHDGCGTTPSPETQSLPYAVHETEHEARPRLLLSADVELQTADGVEYGDTIEHVDFDYAAKLTALNAVVLAGMAWAPAPPGW